MGSKTICSRQLRDITKRQGRRQEQPSPEEQEQAAMTAAFTQPEPKLKTRASLKVSFSMSAYLVCHRERREKTTAFLPGTPFLLTP